MSKFDDKANDILKRFIVENVENSKEVVRINVPGQQPVEVQATCIRGSDGSCMYISDEECDCVQVGEDITDRIIADEEEDAEDLNKSLAGIDLKPEDLAAVDVAGKLATKAGAFGSSILNQAKMNSAYGRLMSNIATKVDNIAKKIK